MNNKTSDNSFHYRGGRVNNFSLTSVNNFSLTNVVIEEGLEAIDSSAFSGCFRLKTIVIPDSVKRIGYRAFYGCHSLNSVIIPNGVTHIYGWAFHLSRITEIVIPESVKSIGANAFSHCKSLKSVVILGEVTVIGRETFSNCISLESIQLPGTLMEIGICAFFGCSRLMKIVIPDSVKSIGDLAFGLCRDLHSISMPDSLQKIGLKTFMGCKSLQTIQLPPSLIEIGELAFRGCDALENFTFPGKLPELKELNLDGYEFTTFHKLQIYTQILAHTPFLVKMTLRFVCLRGLDRAAKCKLDNTHIPLILEMVLTCPNLEYLDVSKNDFTLGVFKMLATQRIPRHLRHLRIDTKLNTAEEPPASEQDSTIDHFLALLENNPRLAIWTNQFWGNLEDNVICNYLDMNRYGCHGKTIGDSVWPLLIERLGELDGTGKENRVSETMKLQTGVPNVLYHWLQNHPSLFVNECGKKEAEGSKIV